MLEMLVFRKILRTFSMNDPLQGLSKTSTKIAKQNHLRFMVRLLKFNKFNKSRNNWLAAKSIFQNSINSTKYLTVALWIKLFLHAKHQNRNKRTWWRNSRKYTIKKRNCQQKENCPMNDASLKENLIRYATISCSDKNYKPKPYKGSCETSFKKCYSKDKKSFNVPLYKHDIKLSTEYWSLKTKQLNPAIYWKIQVL